MKFITILILLLTQVSCVNRNTVHFESGFDPHKVKNIYIDKDIDDNSNLDEAYIAILNNIGINTNSNKNDINVDAVLTYKAKWVNSSKPIIYTMYTKLKDPVTGFPLAYVQVTHTSPIMPIDFVSESLFLLFQ